CFCGRIRLHCFPPDALPIWRVPPRGPRRVHEVREPRRRGVRRRRLLTPPVSDGGGPFRGRKGPPFSAVSRRKSPSSRRQAESRQIGRDTSELQSREKLVCRL